MTNIDEIKDKVSFVLCPCSEGIGYTSPLFKSNWNSLKAHTMIRGACHFYLSKYNPLDQAKFYLSHFANNTEIDMPYVVNFEIKSIDLNSNFTIKKIKHDFALFLRCLNHEGNGVPIILTDIETCNQYLNDPFFRRYPLWISSELSFKGPLLPKNWQEKGWLFCQNFSGTEVLNGTKVKKVFYNGKIDHLKDFIKTKNSQPG